MRSWSHSHSRTTPPPRHDHPNQFREGHARGITKGEERGERRGATACPPFCPARTRKLPHPASTPAPAAREGGGGRSTTRPPPTTHHNTINAEKHTGTCTHDRFNTTTTTNFPNDCTPPHLHVKSIVECSIPALACAPPAPSARRSPPSGRRAACPGSRTRTPSSSSPRGLRVAEN